MSIKVINNFSTTLGSPLVPAATSMVMAAGAGSALRTKLTGSPSTAFGTAAGTTDYIYLTLADVGGNIEIVKLTSIAASGDTATIIRGQDNTTSRTTDWAAGAIVDARPCAAFFTDALLLLAAGAKLDIAQTWVAQQTPMGGTLTDGATISWNADTNGQVVSVTLGGNRTLAAPTNTIENAFYVIRIHQDATGSRTITWDSVYKFPFGSDAKLASAANAVSIFTFIGGAAGVMYCVGLAKGLA